MSAKLDTSLGTLRLLHGEIYEKGVSCEFSSANQPLKDFSGEVNRVLEAVKA